MTNHVNVHQLALLLVKHAPQDVGSHGLAELAKDLADEGVLLPSALTESEVESICQFCCTAQYRQQRHGESPHATVITVLAGFAQGKVGPPVG